jgi:hypothetical protein
MPLLALLPLAAAVKLWAARAALLPNSPVWLGAVRKWCPPPCDARDCRLCDPLCEARVLCDERTPAGRLRRHASSSARYARPRERNDVSSREPLDDSSCAPARTSRRD